MAVSLTGAPYIPRERGRRSRSLGRIVGIDWMDYYLKCASLRANGAQACQGNSYNIAMSRGALRATATTGAQLLAI